MWRAERAGTAHASGPGDGMVKGSSRGPTGRAPHVIKPNRSEVADKNWWGLLCKKTANSLAVWVDAVPPQRLRYLHDKQWDRRHSGGAACCSGLNKLAL